MLSKIIKSPVTGFVIGIGGIIFAVVFYFVVEQKEVKPRYAVSEPETLAEATADAPGLRLLWEDEEIENVHTINIVIWNAGRQYLDKDSISATDPIRITYPPGAKILYMKFTRTSRDNLKFTATDLADAGTSAIQVGIVGDEALERKDGGLLHVLFSGLSTEEFVVTGRIKGSREGFTKVDWGRISASGFGWIALVTIVIGGMFAGAVAVFSQRIFRRFRISKRFAEHLSDITFYLILMLLFVVMTGVEISGRGTRLLFGLPWLP
jgi:hypothetical protein